jgi:hypothetical protein
MNRLIFNALITTVTITSTAVLFAFNGGNSETAQAATLSVSALSNIYGAGYSSPPTQIAGAGILPPVYNFSAATGQVLTFSKVIGSVSYQVGAIPFNGPDGVGAFSTLNWPSINGISGVIDNRGRYLVGVFLDNLVPTSPAPVRLNFIGNNGFQEISPLIGQTFFIGDGLTGTGSGNTQKFNVPDKATRLFLGFIDGDGSGTSVGMYNDNGGSFTADFEIKSTSPKSVPEPSNVFGLGLLGLGLAATKVKGILSKKAKSPTDNSQTTDS